MSRMFALIMQSAVAALVLAACALIPAGPAAAAGFGPTGVVRTPIGPGQDRAQAVAIQADGKIVAAGYSHNGTDLDFALVRHLPDGALDTTFGGTGKVTTAVGNSQDAAFAVAIQPDGKIVAAGYSLGATYDFAVVRYNANGTLDPTFGGTGKVTTEVGTSTDQALAIAIQPDGKIVLAGFSHNGTDDDVALVRYDANGALDTTFNGTGKVTTAIGDRDVAQGLALRPDGRLVAAGFTQMSGFLYFALASYNANGSLDTTFGGTGKVFTPVGTTNGAIAALALQPDGKAVVAGYATVGREVLTAVARYGTDGLLDAAFGGAGLQFTKIGSVSLGHAVALQPDGRIVVAGTGLPGNKHVALTRYDPNGSLDATFNGTGIVVTVATTFEDSAQGVALQPDGKIVIAGYGRESEDDFIVARYLANGLLDPPADITIDSDGDGNPDAIEIRQGYDPLVKDNDVFTNTTLFTMQQYRDFLGREGDPAGIAFHQGLLDAGTLSRAQAIQDFIESGEHQASVAPIARLYSAFFQRLPDYIGLQHHVKALRQGFSLAAIANDFASSPEFLATYGGLSDAAFVTLAYANVLGRGATQAEIDFHVARLQTGETRGEVMTGFSESPEFVNLERQPVFIVGTYAGMYRREPSQAEFDAGVAWLAAGNAPTPMLQGFLGTQAYHDRFLP